MCKFSISLDDMGLESAGDMLVSGSLDIGESNEKFEIPLSYWNKDKYISQWKFALSRLTNGEPCSAVVTTMYNPKTANFIFWWVMYLIDNNVHIQNHVLFLDELDQPFDEEDLYSFIPERETHTEEGEPISEWVVGVTAIERFMDSFNIAE